MIRDESVCTLRVHIERILPKTDTSPFFSTRQSFIKLLPSAIAPILKGSLLSSSSYFIFALQLSLFNPGYVILSITHVIVYVSRSFSTLPHSQFSLTSFLGFKFLHRQLLTHVCSQSAFLQSNLLFHGIVLPQTTPVIHSFRALCRVFSSGLHIFLRLINQYFCYHLQRLSPVFFLLKNLDCFETSTNAKSSTSVCSLIFFLRLDRCQCIFSYRGCRVSLFTKLLSKCFGFSKTKFMIGDSYTQIIVFYNTYGIKHFLCRNVPLFLRSVQVS